MDNRRGSGSPPSSSGGRGDQAQKPFNQNRSFRDRSGGENSFGAQKFQPRAGAYKTKSADDGNNRFQSRGGERRFQNQDEEFQSGAEQNRDKKFQPRDEKFRPRENGGRFQNRKEKFQPSGRFAPKNKNFKPNWQRDEKPLARIVSEMQITDGRHRGKYLETTASKKVHPTTRRVREVMFRILFRRVRAGRFLDLCAGSGMVGLEAISRGALISTFVERSAKMCAFVKKNMEACGVKNGHGEVVCAEAAPFLKQMEKRRRTWDLVYYDPPYDADYEEVLKFFERGAVLKMHGVLVIEHHAEMFFPEIFGAMSRWRVLIQGETALSFYEKK